MIYYSAVVETLILLAVLFEAYVSWKALSFRNRDRIKRVVADLLNNLRIAR